MVQVQDKKFNINLKYNRDTLDHLPDSPHRLAKIRTNTESAYWLRPTEARVAKPQMRKPGL